MGTDPDPTLDELATIALASRGRTNAEIGAELGLTEDGVKSRFARVSLRLRTRNRAHTVAVCLSRGLIPPLREDTTRAKGPHHDPVSGRGQGIRTDGVRGTEQGMACLAPHH